MRFAIATALLFVLAGAAAGADRFPRPDFESGYRRPTPSHPHPRSDLREYVDVVALAVALAAASYLALRRRSRRGVFTVMVLSLLYFGFYRKGCVCPIGAIQNVSLALFDGGYALPLTVAAFFLLPLAATLLFGRTFCAAVCPLGAVQDLVLLRPLKVPAPAEHALGMLPYLYLGAAVLFAATGSAFLICRYDPFVAFFRLSGNTNMLILGACALVIAVFVGRPYCRFLCPYGAVLRPLSRLSKWRVTITPDECIECRLCEDACPFGAIQRPTAEPVPGRRTRGKGVLAALIGLLPVLVVAGGALGRGAHGALARVHATVRLADRVRREEARQVVGTTDASEAFYKTRRLPEVLYKDAVKITARFARGGMLLGAFLGLVLGLKLVQLSVRRRRADYQPDRAKCVSCGRCFRYCPREQLRLKGLRGEAGGETA